MNIPCKDGFEWVEVPWLAWRERRDEGALVAYNGVTRYYLLFPQKPGKVGSVVSTDIGGIVKSQNFCN